MSNIVETPFTDIPKYSVIKLVVQFPGSIRDYTCSGFINKYNQFIPFKFEPNYAYFNHMLMYETEKYKNEISDPFGNKTFHLNKNPNNNNIFGKCDDFEINHLDRPKPHKYADYVSLYFLLVKRPVENGNTFYQDYVIAKPEWTNYSQDSFYWTVWNGHFWLDIAKSSEHKNIEIIGWAKTHYEEYAQRLV